MKQTLGRQVVSTVPVKHILLLQCGPQAGAGGRVPARHSQGPPLPGSATPTVGHWVRVRVRDRVRVRVRDRVRDRVRVRVRDRDRVRDRVRVRG